MERKIVLWFLILYGSLLQSFGSLLEKGADASSDLHSRKKRIIDNSCHSNDAVLYQEVPYVVALLAPNGCVHCTGIILGPHVVLTAAHCFYNHNVTIVSGIPRSPRQQFHTVVKKIPHEHYNANILIVNDLGLVVLREPIGLNPPHAYNRPIGIYNGALPPNSEVLISGWGFFSRDRCAYPTRVRSILVRVLDHQLCYDHNIQYLPITEKHMCTLYPNREKCCWAGDSGAPLVYNGHLVGIFSTYHKGNNPQQADISMNLLDPEYKSWVISKTNHIHENLQLYLH